MNIISSRAVNFLGFWICCGLIGFAYYLQMVLNLQPCPLCVIERLFLALIGLVLLLASIHNPSKSGYKTYGSIVLVLAMLGMAFAARHLWIQANPSTFGQVCVPGFNYLIKTVPFSQVLKALLLGSADCAKVDWSFLGLSLPGWTFLFFDVFALLGLAQIKGIFTKVRALQA